MTINRLEGNEELEERGKCNLELIGLRYVGDQSTLSPSDLQSLGAWPGNSPLQGGERNSDRSRDPGPIQLGLVPDWTDSDVEDRGVHYLETKKDVEVVRDPALLAESLLERNYLPPDVFENGYDADLRDRVFQKLGLEDVGTDNVEGYRRQLREIASLDPEVNSETLKDSELLAYLREQYRHAELALAVETYGDESEIDDPHLADKVELVEELGRIAVEKDRASVERAAEDAREKLEADAEDDDDDLAGGS